MNEELLEDLNDYGSELENHEEDDIEHSFYGSTSHNSHKVPSSSVCLSKNNLFAYSVNFFLLLKYFRMNLNSHKFFAVMLTKKGLQILLNHATIP